VSPPLGLVTKALLLSLIHYNSLPISLSLCVTYLLLLDVAHLLSRASRE
jgi:hypothetical protein